MKVKQLVGRIKNNPSEGWQGAAGIELLVLQFEDKKELNVIRPITLEDMEIFYKVSYETSLKEMISDDYNYCLLYVISDDCELTLTIDICDLENIREATEEDLKEHNKNIEEFKKIHKLSDIEKELEAERVAEEKADEEFNIKDKQKVVVRTTDKDIEVEAVIYKGFAVHDIVGYEKSTEKSITILDGEYKGRSLIRCSIIKCIKVIDNVREYLGDRCIENKDAKKLGELIKSIV